VKTPDRCIIYRNGEEFHVQSAPEEFHIGSDEAYWLGYVDHHMVGELAEFQYDPRPLIVGGDGEVSELATGGLLLGIDRQSRYETATTTISPGSVMLFYTDGLVEAQHGDLEFGEDRLVTLVQDNPDLSAEALRECIVQAARDFVESDIEDDLTLIVLRVL